MHTVSAVDESGELAMARATENVMAAALAYDESEQDETAGRWRRIALWAKYLTELGSHAEVYAKYHGTPRPLADRVDPDPQDSDTEPLLYLVAMALGEAQRVGRCHDSDVQGFETPDMNRLYGYIHSIENGLPRYMVPSVSRETNTDETPEGFDVSRETVIPINELLDALSAAKATAAPEDSSKALGLIKDIGLVANPDCRDGKHGSCSGTGWDYELDSPSHCPCDCHGPNHSKNWMVY